MPSNELFLGGLNKDIRRQDLEDVFGKYGKITRCDIKYVNSYSGTAYGFIGYDDERDAEDALKYENGRKICGQAVMIEFSKSKPWNKSTRTSKYRDRDYRSRHRSRSRTRSRTKSRSRSRSRSRRHGNKYDRRRRSGTRSGSRSLSRSRSKRHDRRSSKRDRTRSRSNSRHRHVSKTKDDDYKKESSQEKQIQSSPSQSEKVKESNLKDINADNNITISISEKMDDENQSLNHSYDKTDKNNHKKLLKQNMYELNSNEHPEHEQDIESVHDNNDDYE